ncbi:hypothetical protein KAT80_02070 [Candidatus Pacearchaeota archaeon]|nr:hypothetical protein [Candidatus Pacearchaeota archaeon]
MKLRGIELAEEVKDVFKEGDFIQKDIRSIREIEKLENKNYDWRFAFFKEGKTLRSYLPQLSPIEILEVYNLLNKNKYKSNFGLIHFSEIPEGAV